MLISKVDADTGTDAPAGAPPIPFVVGAARSGTTLLRLMLDAHPDLAIPPETHFVPHVARRCPRAADPARCLIETIVAAPTWPDFGLDLDALRRRVAELRPFALGAGLAAFYELYAGRFGKPRWGDKTPRYVAHMRVVQDLVPAAGFVHLLRDGRDVALSIRGLGFGPETIDEAAAWWLARVTGGRSQVGDLRRYLEVRYEDLVLDTEPTLRRICAFLDLPWHPAMLDYHVRAGERLAELAGATAPTSGSTPGAGRTTIHALTGRPPEASRVGRWRRELDPTACAQFEAVAGGLLRDLGYETGCPLTAPPAAERSPRA